MSGREDNLRVVTEHLAALAGNHDATSGRLLAAGRVARGFAGEMWRTHGIACAAANLAANAAESERVAALRIMYRKSVDLRDRLLQAAANYTDTDWRESERIGRCAL
ncbi:ESX-1 secretion-associated protein [uncultured Mycolicibacterium sp.]|uniref:ESX-1 secretion-associated protein n=1 Tax=uncultured Mycolicibacterium sp. TaxID=2320817 RepID=UPI002603A5FB|nr:ESX-1 secretion-associated protein [uncultured Mycolicibacterium sp.]